MRDLAGYISSCSSDCTRSAGQNKQVASLLARDLDGKWHAPPASYCPERPSLPSCPGTSRFLSLSRIPVDVRGRRLLIEFLLNMFSAETAPVRLDAEAVSVSTLGRGEPANGGVLSRVCTGTNAIGVGASTADMAATDCCASP